MKAYPPLPTVSARDVIAIGAAVRSAAADQAPVLPVGRGAVQIPLLVRARVDGGADLVDAETGAIVSPCASAEVARRTKEFFA